MSELALAAIETDEMQSNQVVPKFTIIKSNKVVSPSTVTGNLPESKGTTFQRQFSNIFNDEDNMQLAMNQEEDVVSLMQTMYFSIDLLEF